MDKDRKDPNRAKEVPGIVPEEESQLKEILRDKRIFGVFHDEEGADRAIRQLNKLGYGGGEIFLFSRDPEKTSRIQENYTEDIEILSCSDGSDFVGESYNKGDMVICIPRDFDPAEKVRQAHRRRWSETTADVQGRMPYEKKGDEEEDI